jgi:hypothetical protein
VCNEEITKDRERHEVHERNCLATSFVPFVPFVVFSCFFGFIVQVSAVETPVAPTATTAPRIELPERDFNFGQAVAGVAVEHVFKFRNAGSADLVIRRVKPSCVCTAALLSKSVLKPGEEGAIQARFETGDKLGFHDIQIQVVTNDDLEKDLGENVSLLHLRGQVENLLSVLPTAFYYPSPFLRGSPSERRVTVLPTDVPEVTATSTEVSSPFFRVTTAPYQQGGRKGFEVITTMAPGIPLGRLEARVIVHTDHPKQQALRIPIFGVVNGTFAEFPERIQLYPHEGQADPTISFLRLAGDGPVPIDGVEAPPFLDVQPGETIPKGAEFTLKLKAGLKPGPFSGVVRIFLRDPEQPVFEVPITGEVPRRVTVDPPGAWLDAAHGRALLHVFGAKPKAAVAQGGPFTAALDEEGRVAVALAPDAPPGAFKGSIRIKTDVPGEEDIEVAVRGAGPGK